MMDATTPTRPSRRRLLGWLGASAAVPLFASCGSAKETRTYPVAFSDAEWKKRLTPAQYYILRKEGTERPGASPLLKEHRKGTFVCAADGNPLYSSATKFESGTGWPSFWKPLPGGVLLSPASEDTWGRVEVHCAKCGGHLGHVFDDGPPPTGKRYCMNGDAMKFVVG